MITRHTVLLSFVLLLSACGTTSVHVDTDSLGRTVPWAGKPHDIPGTIEAEHYNEGAPGEAYSDVDAKNHGVDYRDATQVDIEKRPDASNGHGIGWTRAGEWVVYTVLVRETGTYSVEFPVASNKKGGTFHLEFNGADVTGPIRVPDTGGWQKLQTISSDNVHLEAGTYLMKMVMDTEGPSTSIGDIDLLRFTRT